MDLIPNVRRNLLNHVIVIYPDLYVPHVYLLYICVVIVFVLVVNIYIQDLQVVLFVHVGLVRVIVELVEIFVYNNQLLMSRVGVLLTLFQVVYMVLIFVALNLDMVLIFVLL